MTAILLTEATILTANSSRKISTAAQQDLFSINSAVASDIDS